MAHNPRLKTDDEKALLIWLAFSPKLSRIALAVVLPSSKIAFELRIWFPCDYNVSPED